MAPEPRLRTRNEGTKLRPFAGLELIEEALEISLMTVSHEFGEYSVNFGGQIKVPHRALSRLGFRVDFSNSAQPIRDAVQSAGIPLERVDFVVLARDPGASPIKETALVMRVALPEIHGEVSILAREQDRPRTMVNKHDGFDLEFLLVLNDALPYKALRPRLKGTILATSSVAIHTTDISSGLQPRKLTNPIRQDNELPRDSWIWTSEIDSLVNSQTLGDCLSIYVDDEILRLTPLLPDDVRVIAEYVFTIPTLVGVILSASRELQQEDLRDFVFDGRNSAVLSLIYQKVRKAEGGEMPLTRFTKLLRDDAPRIVAYATADKNTRKALRKALSNLIGENDDVSEA